MRSNTGLVFALPALIVLFMLIAYPVSYTGWLSVTNDQGQFTGLQNFSAVLRPRVTTQALWNTLWWVLRLHLFPGAAGGRGGDPAQPELHGPRARALHRPHPLADPGDRRRHDLGMDVPHRVRDHQLHAHEHGRTRRASGLAHALAIR